LLLTHRCKQRKGMVKASAVPVPMHAASSQVKLLPPNTCLACLFPMSPC
jgi:hypothetical protein